MSNTSWTQLIKQIAKEERAAAKPCDVILGNVESADPLKVDIGRGVKLDNVFLLVCESVSDKLKIGDTVMLIRQGGGQRFFLVDRLI